MRVKIKSFKFILFSFSSIISANLLKYVNFNLVIFNKNENINNEIIRILNVIIINYFNKNFNIY